ncbi:MAG: CHAT domain-containing protein, partial [Planctomycetota bacterium]|nr:CHAT domain-containing protein [Planctomycetota bacterium]
VVASLWKVPDEESRDLMIEFHRARREEGLEPVEALRAAQAVIAARKDTRPLDWAAWVVWGPRR